MLFAKIKRYFFVATVLGLLFTMSQALPLSAQTVTQGYGSDTVLERGTIVMLSKNNTSKVEPLSADFIDRMHGVVVNANDAPVTISSEGQKVFIATVGRYEVLVNDQNGAIKNGDYISISSVNGIGMKAKSNQPIVLGKALSSFDGKTNAISTTEAKTSDGKTRSVAIGRVGVDITIGRNPLQKTESNVPEVLRKATSSIANKQVSPFRAYLSIVIFFATAAVAASMLYAGIRTSFIAVGRNPLSRKTISRSLTQVILTSLIIFLSGIFGVYLLLKL